MKEQRFFYAPHASIVDSLPEEEATHAVRVLRMKPGDEVFLMDGVGTFYKALLVEANKKGCRYKIVDSISQEKGWNAYLHIAMAPTKNIDRTEWFVEKAVEVGVDEITFLNTDFSERKKVNVERMQKIAIAAMKQSRKPFLTKINNLTDFTQLVTSKAQKNRFICHCYEELESGIQTKKILLNNAIDNSDSLLVAVGPEGDFSINEVKEAINQGFQPASLGNSRLRTETAALMAAHIMNLNTMNENIK